MDICAFNKINILNAQELFYWPWIYCYEADPGNWRHEAKQSESLCKASLLGRQS